MLRLRRIGSRLAIGYKVARETQKITLTSHNVRQRQTNVDRVT